MSIMHSIKNIMPERMPSFGAVFYSGVPAKIFEPYYKLIADEIPLKEDGLFLDIGTGPGMLPIDIAKRLPRLKIIGIDLSEKMIQIAGKNKIRRNTDNVEFKVMDANAMQFADNSIDFVLSTGSLHHWKKPAVILDEIYRCLKPGCQAWIYDGYGGASDDDINKGIRRLCCGFPWNSLVRRVLSIHGFTQNEYETTISKIHIHKG